MAPDVQRLKGRPTLDEAAALKDRILDRTLSSIREKGSRGFSVDHIAAVAGVTKRTIYRHFASKAELIDAVIRREIDRLLGHMSDGTCDEADPMERLETWARAYFHQSLEPEMIAFLNFVSFEVHGDVQISARLQHWYGLIVDHIAGLIDDAQRVGAIRTMDSRETALLLIDLINGRAHRRRFGLIDADLSVGSSPETYFQARWQTFRHLVTDR